MPETAVDDLGRLAPERPELAAWLVAHDLEPTDPPTAAGFLLVTGQRARYHALDPDHALLRAAFTGGGPARQGGLLAGVAAAGLDPAVVAGGGLGSGPLWELPAADAAAAVARFGAWRPAAAAAAALFDRLAAADPAALAATVAALPEPYDIPLLESPIDVAFSPDGERLAFDGGDGRRDRLVDVDADTGRVLSRYRRDYRGYTLTARTGFFPSSPRMLVHYGDAVVGIDRLGLSRYERGQHVALHSGAQFCGVVRLGAGFVALRIDGLLIFGDPRRVTSRSVAAQTAFGGAPGRWIAASPDGEHIAAASQKTLVVLDGRRRRLLARPAGGSGYGGVALAEPGYLVALADGRLIRWRIDGDRLEAVAETAAPHSENLDVVDGTGLLVARESGPRYYDATSLEPVAPAAIEDASIQVYPRHAAGRFAFVTRRAEEPRYGLRVLPSRADHLARRPLRELTPADAGRLDAAAREAPSGRRELYELLRDCARLRFATEVALGDGPVAADDDIEIGGGA
ncbi:hypothetical protein [Dactylosporangium sp. NPDC049140]|uniref:hypothetical protein n=1 Tax=Dactylosporangium sp. NPDC049140 TaxID=3155647 RepID=UPI0033CBECF5